MHFCPADRYRPQRDILLPCSIRADGGTLECTAVCRILGTNMVEVLSKTVHVPSPDVEMQVVQITGERAAMVHLTTRFVVYCYTSPLGW